MDLLRLENWSRFQKYFFLYPDLGMSLDISRVNFPNNFLDSMAAPMRTAFQNMEALERGAIANPDENRMVGHYWLRNPALAPSPEIRKEIEDTLIKIKSFSQEIHDGRIRGQSGPFKRLLLIGIGGSALGPQFVSRALGHPLSDKLQVFFFDNTDPDGMDNTLSQVKADLGSTLCIVVSKSGGTKETRNGMLEAKAAYEKAGLDFAKHTVAVTSQNSELDKLSMESKWLARFPMWDWVGGRTSELSSVGLLPAALQGLNIQEILDGAKCCDDTTRTPDLKCNPAALVAAVLFFIGNGKGSKNMVVLPYKDRLELFSKYLQQLFMESLGKANDLSGKTVHQGITVFGNKGSTDQHSYIQQLRDGLDNFFVTFIRVLRDRRGKSIEVEPDVTSGDYLDGFFQGTREALFQSNRQSITITIGQVSPFSIGVLIALFERVVGLYATLINVNAYHQPGVEAGKKAAAEVINLQLQILKFLRSNKHPYTVTQIAKALGAEDKVETIFNICEHMRSNIDHGVRGTSGDTSFEMTYQAS
jgi:glucose-6-phosphate isomerase